jgi:hypothetical protein
MEAVSFTLRFVADDARHFFFLAVIFGGWRMRVDGTKRIEMSQLKSVVMVMMNSCDPGERSSRFSPENSL